MKKAAIFCALLTLLPGLALALSDEDIERLKPAVVAIYCDENLELLRGTGFVISPSGNLLTNNHVVRNCSNFWAQFYNKEKFQIAKQTVWERRDMALFRIIRNEKSGPFPFLAFGKPADIALGKSVVAIGHGGSMWRAVRGRIVGTRVSNLLSGAVMIDFTPSIIGGFSGGPLLDENGKVVGMNTFGARNIADIDDSKDASAIHIAEIESFLVDYPNVQRGLSEHLRAFVKEMFPQGRRAWKSYEEKGIEIEQVIPGGLAEMLDLRAGDAVIMVGNRWVNNVTEFQEIMANFYGSGASLHHPDCLTLQILRGQTLFTVRIKTAPVPEGAFPRC
jgi:serine protease Do